LSPLLRAVLLADTWPKRESHLSAAYAIVAEMHNALGITDPLPTQVSAFHSRPFMVIHGERFAEAIRETITDDAIKQIAERPLIGAVDQFSDSTDILESAQWRETLTGFYR